MEKKYKDLGIGMRRGRMKYGARIRPTANACHVPVMELVAMECGEVRATRKVIDYYCETFRMDQDDVKALGL